MSLEVALAVIAGIDALSSAKQAFDPESTGGGGGATKAGTPSGQASLQYQDLVGTGITPFEYQEYQEQLAAESEQREMADAMALAQQQGLWSGGLISLMQGGPLYANEGREIEEVVVRAPPLESPSMGVDQLAPGEIGLTPGAPELAPTADLKGDLEEMLARQRRQDIIEAITKGIGAIAKAKQAFDPETTQFPSSRTSVVPLPGGGIGKRQAPYPEPKGSGITPFTYQGVAGGGALGRSMFAQNYMPRGGAMQGPGGPKSDLIPVMASDGEYMLSKAAVDQAGGGNHTKGIARLEQFNRLGNRRYG